MNEILSSKQLEIINKRGKFVVSACAGSGKTFTLSKKLVQLIEENSENHKGIATLSFTNAAWKEIKKNFDEWDLEITYPNFIGTFDRFINKYIFYQYYYLLDEFDVRPTLVGDLGIPWRGGDYERDPYRFFDIFSFDEHDNLIKTKDIRLPFTIKKENADESPDKNYTNIIIMKFNLFKKGFVTQDDINYFSLKLIKDFDFISNIIANKFPIFLIDESQDTNDIKMKIMEKILNNDNIEEFMFIGDFNQAIYEWNGANPKIFEELMDKYETLTLNENWRSSKKICEFTSKLSNQNCIAVNEEIKDFSFEPEIWGYDVAEKNKYKLYNDLIDDFLKTCVDNNVKINKDDVAVLCKGNRLIKTINGQQNYNYEDLFHDNHNILYDLIYSKFLFDKGKFKESYLKLEKILISVISNKRQISMFNKKEVLNNIGFFKIRRMSLELINLMPTIDDKSLNKWVGEFKLKLQSSNLSFREQLLENIWVSDKNSNYISVEDLFNFDKNEKFLLSTIHGVKAKTFDATLLILKTRTDKGGYKKIIDEFYESGDLSEDLRNVYVGITRPRKILVMAVPKTHEKLWCDLFYDRGYVENGQSSLFDFGK